MASLQETRRSWTEAPPGQMLEFLHAGPLLLPQSVGFQNMVRVDFKGRPLGAAVACVATSNTLRTATCSETICPDPVYSGAAHVGQQKLLDTSRQVYRVPDVQIFLVAAVKPRNTPNIHVDLQDTDFVEAIFIAKSQGHARQSKHAHCIFRWSRIRKRVCNRRLRLCNLFS